MEEGGEEEVGVTLEAADVAVVGSGDEPGRLRPPVRICTSRQMRAELKIHHGV